MTMGEPGRQDIMEGARRSVTGSSSAVRTLGPLPWTAAECSIRSGHARVDGLIRASEATHFLEFALGHAMNWNIERSANGIGRTHVTLEVCRADRASGAVWARGALGHLRDLRREDAA